MSNANRLEDQISGRQDNSLMFPGGGTPAGDGRSTGSGCSPSSQNISGPKLLLSEAHVLSWDQEVVEGLGGRGGSLGEICSA